MKISSFIFCLCLLLPASSFAQNEPDLDHQKRDGGPGRRAAHEFKLAKDPATGRVPMDKFMEARLQTINLKSQSTLRTSALTWVERGSNTDAVGVSNGNTRANAGITSGRMRAILVDAADATGKTVWVGGVDGGLWKTTDITLTTPTWTLVNDFLNNLAVSGICQDPTNSNIMYFCTGEGFFNADAVQGVGVFKSIDHGVTWNLLASTSAYTLCTKILCDNAGRIYLGTNGQGILRSADGGTTWTTITPTGSSSRIGDIELSSTGRLHVTTGLGTSSIGVYRYTDIPATVAAGTWTSAAVPFTYPTGANCRVELGCSGNTVYALPSNTSARVTTIYKSTNGGANWAAVTFTATNQNDFNGINSPAQAWYCLAIDIDPSNTNNVIIGNLNCLKTTDGGVTWTKLSEWVGTSGQYVHADQQIIKWYDNGNKLLIGCDGGIHYSSDKGVTIRDRNVGLRLKQFYSCAIHPSTTNYFLAGSQDNGVHQFSNAGLSSSVEVTGGDGAFVAIDQNQSQYQYGSYVYNVYRRSTNSGSNWSTCGFYKGTSVAASNFGSFINPFDYDNTNNILYGGADGGEFFRWTTAQTTTSGNYFLTDGYPVGASIVTGITGFNSATVSAVYVSPYTANLVYFGTSAGRVVKIAGANTAANGTAGTNITGASFPVGGSVSCIVAGTTDNNLMATFSNYGVSNVWVTTDGGTNWTAVDGNLPNMPVRWAMFYPGDNTKAYIATETGVWETDLLNGASTVWVTSPSFPVVRTDMIKYRPSDRTIAAATHGRGLWTTTVSCQTITVTNPVTATGTANASFNQTFTQSGALGGTTFTINTGTLPTGLALSSAGVLSGTPTQTGNFPLTIKVTDGFACTGIGVTYNLVIGCQSISVTNPGVTTGTTGVSFSQTFTQTGAIGSTTFSLNSGTLPTGLTLSTAGVLSGTPTQGGTFPITVKVTDANGCMGTGTTYSLVINCSPSIVVTNPATTTGLNGVAFSQTFTQTGAVGGATFTINTGTLPTGLTLSSGGVLSGTPTQSGSFPITVRVTAGNGCIGTGATYNLLINTCAAIAVTNPATTTGLNGVAFSQTFTQTGAVGGATFTINTGTLPTGLTLSSGGVLSGTPTQTGSFPITVKVTGGNGCTGTGATYNLVINTCAVITVTNPATTTGLNGVAFSQTFTQTGAVGGATFTINTGTLPTGLTLSSGGVLSGTPTQSGSFPITVRVTGGNGCIGTGATYNLVINTCAAITVTNPATTTGLNGVAFSQTFTQTGAVGGATFTINTGTLPTGLALSSGGVLSGTPTQSGSFPITVRVTGGNGCTGTGATYNLVINTCAAITVTNPATATGILGIPFSQTFTQSGAVGGATFSINTGTLPTGLSLGAGGTLSGTPAQTGSFPITVKVTGGNGCTGTGTTYNLVISSASSVTLNLTLFLEGFYTAPNTMITNLFDLGINATPTATDSITVNLWSVANLPNPNPNFTVRAMVNSNGTATMQFPGAVNGGSYYIVVKHRNHIETWSSSPVLFSTTTSYNFSTAQAQAYDDGVDGNPPMKAVSGSKFAFYSGDVNQDGGVDGTDASDIEIDINGFAFGYYASDANGDGSSDGLDASLVEVNSNLFIFYSRP